MATPPPPTPVQKSVNRVLAIWGADRRLFFVAAITGVATFNLFGSLLGGLGMFGALYGLARWATAVDPEMLRIVLNSSRQARYFDPSKRRNQIPEAAR
jgi:type IV secretory pathway TrbD component